MTPTGNPENPNPNATSASEIMPPVSMPAPVNDVLSAVQTARARIAELKDSPVTTTEILEIIDTIFKIIDGTIK